MRRDLRSRLRPMNFTDILDETIELYKSNFKLLVGIAAFIYVPYYLLNGFIQQPGFDSNTNPTQAVASTIINLVYTILFYVIFHPIATGALTLAISERYLSREISIKECYRRILQRKVLLPFMGANILVGIIVCSIVFIPCLIIGAIIGVSFLSGNSEMSSSFIVTTILAAFAFIAVILLMLYVMLRYTLVAPAFIIEMNGAVNSLRRSWTLMKGSILKAFGLLLLIAVVVSAVTGITAGPAAILSAINMESGKDPSQLLLAITTIITALVSTLAAPLSSIVTILLYYDIRIRREGFDLELLARELDEKTREIGTQDITALPQEQVPVQNHPIDSE